ncbi:MAG: hypothetical protein U5K54_09460 [Cytophagales bacterium]|nr:hypothetical protein [Cytophagales bacterium]
MKKLLILICVLNSFLAVAQKTTFDIANLHHAYRLDFEIKTSQLPTPKRIIKTKGWCPLLFTRVLKAVATGNGLYQ